MNIDLRKIRGCLTSFFAVLVAASVFLATPANAAVYNISDYFDYNEVDKDTDTRTAYYTVDVDPYTRVSRGDGSFVTEGYGSFDWYFPNTESSNYRAVISVYPFGGLLYTNSAAHDFVLDVSDIMDGSQVSISADISVRFDEMTGIQMPTLDISYRSFIIAYDANMKFVANTLTDWKSSSLVAEGVAEVENSVNYTLPRNTFYIGIVSQFRIDSTYEIGTMHWGVAPRPVVLSVPIDMIYEQSQTMQKIEQQLGDLNSGGVAGDALGNSTDNLDKDNSALGGALDDYHNAQDKLPTAPENLDDVIDKDAIDNAVTDAGKIFDWDNSGLSYMYVPMGLSLSLSVLFYVVFGKD